MTFNEEGLINPVEITTEGVEARTIQFTSDRNERRVRRESAFLSKGIVFPLE